MKRPVLPIIIAILLALGAALAVFLYASSAEDRAVSTMQPVVVLVSTNVIPAGTTLGDASNAGLIESQQVPEKLSPPGAITAVTETNSGQMALTDIPAGQILQASAFGTELPADVPLEVPAGMLAVSLSLQDPAKVGSFLRPGSLITIYNTITLVNDDPTAQSVRSTRRLLDGIQVLAIGPVTEAQAASAPPEAWASVLVTVAVDQKQAEKLVHGIQTGSLYFALQGEDLTFTPSTGVSDEDLFN